MSLGTEWLELVQDTVCGSKRVMTCPLPPPPPDIPPSAAPPSRSRSPTRAGSMAPTSPRHIPQRSRMRASLSACRNTKGFEFDKAKTRKKRGGGRKRGERLAWTSSRDERPNKKGSKREEVYQLYFVCFQEYGYIVVYLYLHFHIFNRSKYVRTVKYVPV